MELMNQPFTGQLGDRLISSLGSGDFHTLNFAVAFAKNSGVLRIKDSLEKFREKGGTVNAFVGVDLCGTSYEALTTLLLYTDSLNIVHAEKSQTFHVKIYQFLGDDKAEIIVGSHNMTGGGLWTNFESSIIVSVDESNDNEIQISKELENYFEELRTIEDSIMPISKQDDIELLLKNGYVIKEITEHVRQIKSAKVNKISNPLFGKGAPAKLPKIAPHKERKKTVEAIQAKPDTSLGQEVGHSIWFETRKMTGGSRNILDLSKKSLIETGDPSGTTFDLGEQKFMRGAVEFFGLNPEDINREKDIVINFDGVDYLGNTILFPKGDNANGTWRLQIKGINANGEKITDVFRTKGEDHYLVNKIIVFSKVEDNSYFLSVFPMTEVENLKEASYILARNGSFENAKLFGLL